MSEHDPRISPAPGLCVPGPVLSATVAWSPARADAAGVFPFCASSWVATALAGCSMLFSCAPSPIDSNSGQADAARPEVLAFGRQPESRFDGGTAGVAAGASLGPRRASWTSVASPRVPKIRRRLLLDRASDHVHLEQARELLGADGSGRGQGVIIGVVDSGIDVTHADLRNLDGTSRMEWWLDFGTSPLGLHPELEEAYECDGEIRCAILGPEELDRLAQGEQLFTPSGDPVSLPRDRLGHGTHVASLALGNGRSNPRYAGIAPEATLIGARIATSGIEVDDADIIRATRFVFERAEEVPAPVVVNLSLGGDIGPHDGTARVEQALAQWVEEGQPGRAIVVAAGNSGSLRPSDGIYPGPLGVHTDVHVPGGTEVRVPLLVPGEGPIRGTFFVWLAAEPDNLDVALEQGDGRRVLDFVTQGEIKSASNGSTQATIVHHRASDEGVADTERGIAVVVGGELEGGSVFALVLRGEANVDLWVQSEGGLGPGSGTVGVLFPAATRERTVTIPATSPRLIAVGATLNRLEWPSFDDTIALQTFDAQLDLEVGAPLFFSSAGPNARGVIKPDLVAPGGVVVGAVAAGAEALRNGSINGGSVFGPTPLCDSLGCAQVDERHGVTLGTSMAAPLVSGALALLFEQDSSLSQDEALALLQAGSTRVMSDSARAGGGLLNVENAFYALAQRDTPGASANEATTAASYLSWGESYARPGAEQPLRALVQLRDSDEQPLQLDDGELSLRIVHGHSPKGLERKAPGLYALAVLANRGTGGESLLVEVFHQDRLLVRSAVPIGVDHHVAEQGVSVRGGCNVRAPSRASMALSAAIVLFAVGCGRLRRFGAAF